MAKRISAARKMSFGEQVEALKAQGESKAEQAKAEFKIKLEAFKTREQAKQKLEEAASESEADIEQVSSVVEDQPEIQPAVEASEAEAITKIEEAKDKAEEKIEEVAALVQQVEEAPVASVKEPVKEPEVKTISPEILKASIEDKRSDIKSKITFLEGVLKKSREGSEDYDMAKRTLGRKINELDNFNKINPPVEEPKDEVVAEVAQPEKVVGSDERPEGRVSEIVLKPKETPVTKEEVRPKEAHKAELISEAERKKQAYKDYLLKMIDLVKDEDEKALIQKHMDEKSPRIRLTALMNYIEDNVEGRPSDPKSWSKENKEFFNKAMRRIVDEIKGFGGMHIEPGIIESLHVAEKLASLKPEEVEPPKSGEKEVAATEKKLSPEEIKARVAELVKKAEGLFLSPEEIVLENPEEMLKKKKHMYIEIMGDIIKEPEEVSLNEGVTALEDALPNYFKLLDRLAARNEGRKMESGEVVMRAEKIKPKDYAYHSKELRQVINRLKGVASEEVHPAAEEPIKKPEVVVEVKETPPVEPVVEESKVVEAEPEKTETEAFAMAEDKPIPEYRPLLLYAKKKDQLEARLAVIKNLPVNEWSETYGEPGGFDQALWEQLEQGKDNNEKKRFQELEYNQAEYSIKELETHERLKAIHYGLGERVKILEDEHPTDERREDLEQQITELQQAERAAYLEIRGIEDLRNKDKAEEKSLFISAQERAAEAAKKSAASKTPSVRVASAPKTPEFVVPGEFEEEENLVAGLFEINDKIKQVEKALQVQRELMPRSVLARGMGLEGNEEALKNAEKIMQHHKVIRALEYQLAELEEEKEVLMGKQTETGQETNQETKVEENALLKEWKKRDSTEDQGDKSVSKVGVIAKKGAVGLGAVAGLGAVGALGAFVKFQYWARWKAPLAMLEFLMKATGDPGGMLKKGVDHLEKSASKFVEKKSKKETKE
ncbi:MAG: hypothetical protein WC750_03715 [Patescibacteria group bacterium]|jgi:hypothetical protein